MGRARALSLGLAFLLAVGRAPGVAAQSPVLTLRSLSPNPPRLASTDEFVTVELIIDHVGAEVATGGLTVSVEGASHIEDIFHQPRVDSARVFQDRCPDGARADHLLLLSPGSDCRIRRQGEPCTNVVTATDALAELYLSRWYPGTPIHMVLQIQPEPWASHLTILVRAAVESQNGTCGIENHPKAIGESVQLDQQGFPAFRRVVLIGAEASPTPGPASVATGVAIESATAQATPSNTPQPVTTMNSTATPPTRIEPEEPPESGDPILYLVILVVALLLLFLVLVAAHRLLSSGDGRYR